VEGHAIDNRDKEEGPVGAAFRDGGVACVIDWEEDVCCVSEVGKGTFDGQGIGGLHEHESH